MNYFVVYDLFYNKLPTFCANLHAHDTYILTNNNKGNRWVLVVNYDLEMGSRFKRFMGRVKLQQQQKHTNQQKSTTQNA
jgi:hypothetical protein